LADAGYDATPQTPDAAMTSVEVIQMPEDVAPAPEAVVEVQATFGGVSTDDARDADFQAAIRGAVAEALDVDESQVLAAASAPRALATPLPVAPRLDHPPRAVAAPPLSLLSLRSLSLSPSPPFTVASQVIITDVDTDDEGDVVVTYVVTGMDPADVEEAAATLETREVADAIVEQMQDQVGTHRLRVVGCGGVAVAAGRVGRPSCPRPGVHVYVSHASGFRLFVATLPAAFRVRASTTWPRGPSMPATPPWRSRKCP